MFCRYYEQEARVDAREYMGMRLKALRKARGLNADQLGSAVGKSGKTISAWEVGRGQPDADMLVLLCKVLGAHIADFYFPDTEKRQQWQDDLLSVVSELNQSGVEKVLQYARDVAANPENRI